ncbi:type II toxin-antitoxin system ParD family antitoxin [uncultured Marinobacter sp.]|uniref:type II toxin-antitoxin system ParD family antitoxin n=1 Tax=uncultured Marinobacter sp. TaxID=187379 RepID=UPI0030DB0626
MATRNVVLTDHQTQVIESLVASGRYQNASEVVRAGLRMIEEAEAVYEDKLQALREAVNVGLKDVEEGRTMTFTSDEFSEYLEERAKMILSKGIDG